MISSNEEMPEQDAATPISRSVCMFFPNPNLNPVIDARPRLQGCVLFDVAVAVIEDT